MLPLIGPEPSRTNQTSTIQRGMRLSLWQSRPNASMKLCLPCASRFQRLYLQEPGPRVNPMNGQDQRQQAVGSMSADDRKGMPSAVRIDFGPPTFAHARPRLQRTARGMEGLLRSGQLDWLSMAGFAPRDGCDWLGDQAFA